MIKMPSDRQQKQQEQQQQRRRIKTINPVVSQCFCVSQNKKHYSERGNARFAIRDAKIAAYERKKPNSNETFF